MKAENVTMEEYEEFKHMCPDEAQAIEKESGRTLFESESYDSTDSFDKMIAQTALNYFVLGLRTLRG